MGSSRFFGRNSNSATDAGILTALTAFSAITTAALAAKLWATMMVVNHTFFVTALIMFGAAALVWISPRPETAPDITQMP